jgi:hypothetical protein
VAADPRGSPRPSPPRWRGSALSPSAFDEELLKSVYDTALLAAGVTVRYHSFLSGVEKTGARLASRRCRALM